MKKSKKEMPLINFKGILGRFVSLDVITNKFYADEIPYYTYAQYELTMITDDGYEVKVKPINQEDADRIIIVYNVQEERK